MADEDDKKLYKKFLEGDKKALETIIKKYEKNLKYFILKYVKDQDVAEDIYQSVIVYILEKKEMYDDQYSLKTYLYTIAKSRALNYIKKQNKEIVDIEDETIILKEERLLEDIILSKQRKEKIVNVMKKMSMEYQQVIFLTIIEGLSYQETAQIMDKTTSQIKNLVHRARQKMKKLLVDEKVIKIKNNKIINLIAWTIIIVFISTSVVYASLKIYETIKNNASLTLTFTEKMGDTDTNSIWVGSFNLAWNDFMDKYTKGNVEFKDGNTELVNELNKQTFTKGQISESDYYIKMGKTSKDLKEQIQEEVKSKFGIEGSEVLANIDFENAYPKSFTIYSILYKEFEFLVPFDRVSDGQNFGESEEKVKYFGITAASDDEIRENVEVLFYNSKNEFAVKLKTKQKEEIILYRTDENKSFEEYYNELKLKAENYEGSKNFEETYELKVPNINIDTIINYDELCGREIKGQKGLYIQNAIQNVKFMLNETGGKISSESAVKTSFNCFLAYTPLRFYFNDTFVMFMKEEDKDKPYMALKVDDTDILEIGK